MALATCVSTALVAGCEIAGALVAGCDVSAETATGATEVAGTAGLDVGGTAAGVNVAGGLNPPGWEWERLANLRGEQCKQFPSGEVKPNGRKPD